MALVAVAMTCVQGTRFSDSFGGCNSYAFTTIGTDARWLGPKFSLMFRLKLQTPGATLPGALVGCASSVPVARRFWLEVDPNGSLFTIRGQLNTTACGAVTVTTFTKTQDTSEHSVAWTYDQAGSWATYWDGAPQGSGAAPCANLSGPASAGDIFIITGAANFAGAEVFNIDRVFYANDIMTATQVANAHGNCSLF